MVRLSARLYPPGSPGLFHVFRPTRLRHPLRVGLHGLRALLPGSDAIVIVDVLSFSTSVDVAVGRGAQVYPYNQRDEWAEAVARQHDAILATRTRGAGPSLSPASLGGLAAGSRLVLPSPNGATLSLATGDVSTFAACLRNAAAVARAAASAGGQVTVIAAGERWPDGSVRFAVEDWLGAGAVIHHLPGERSVEAAMAEAAFVAARADLPTRLRACDSGRELSERGFEEDVRLASELNVSAAAPRLLDGAYRWQPLEVS